MEKQAKKHMANVIISKLVLQKKEEDLNYW